jgi:hypothetical protein
MEPERRDRLVRVVVELLLAEMERAAVERGNRSAVGGTVSTHPDALEDVP